VKADVLKIPRGDKFLGTIILWASRLWHRPVCEAGYPRFYGAYYLHPLPFIFTAFWNLTSLTCHHSGCAV
jgi:hypothetical protein